MVGLFIDFIFSSYSFEIKHFLINLIFSTIYMLINLGYSLYVEPVYSALSWKSGLSYGILIGSYVLTLIVFGIGILVFKCLK